LELGLTSFSITVYRDLRHFPLLSAIVIMVWEGLESRHSAPRPQSLIARILPRSEKLYFYWSYVRATKFSLVALSIKTGCSCDRNVMDS